jgi:hypothetical protein
MYICCALHVCLTFCFNICLQQFLLEKVYLLTLEMQAVVQASFYEKQSCCCLFLSRNEMGSQMFSGNPKYPMLCKHAQNFSSRDRQAEVSMYTDAVLQLHVASKSLSD